MVVFGSPETWEIKVDEFIDSKKPEIVSTPSQQLFGIQRSEYEFGGGVEARKKGTEASRQYFKSRQVDKITPTFYEGKLGIKGPQQDIKNYLFDFKKRFDFPVTSGEYFNLVKSGELLDNAGLAKKYGINNATVERVNRYFKKEYELNYPAQTYEGERARQRKRDVIRKENIKKSSSLENEKKLKNIIKDINPTALANDVDLAHRASLKANAALGTDYAISSLGLDKKIINQEVVRSTEQKLGKLYDDQKKLIKNLEPGKVPVETQKKIEQINLKISELSDRTKGTLQGVLIDEKTLKPITYGKNYSKVLGLGVVDKPVKSLTPEDFKIIEMNVTENLKRAKLENPKLLSKFIETAKSSGPTLGMNLGLGKALLTGLEVLGTPAAALAFAGSEFKRGLDEGKTVFESATAPTVGASLLGPGVASRLKPGLLKGALGLGKAARFFTPTGIGLLAAGQAKDFYDQYKNLEQMKETDPQAYEAFINQRVSEEVNPEQQAEIEAMGREGAMGGGIMRIGLKDGPEDPSKRKALKIGLGILGALPFGVTKIFQKPAVQEAITKAAPAAERGWSWVKDNFWDVVGAVKNKSKTFAKLKDGEVTIHKDMEVIENPETIRVRYKTDNGNTAETVYTKPSKEVNPETGEIIDIPGDFEEYQDVYRLGDGEVYKDFEEEIIDSVDNVKKILDD